MIISKTPVRIEIGGGATDVEPYTTDHGGFVVNTTINQYINSTLRKRQDSLISITIGNNKSAYNIDIDEGYDQFSTPNDLIEAIILYMKPSLSADIKVQIDPPKKAGLGASASLSTSLIAGISKLEKKSIEINEIAEKAYHVEQDVLKNIGGRQDQYASVYGGFNCIEFMGGSDVRVETLKISKDFMEEIEENLILFYTGEPHTSGTMVGRQVDSYLKKKEESTAYLDKLKDYAYQMKDSLNEEEFQRFGELLTKDLIVKSKFNPLLFTEYMKDLNNMVMKKGGIGGRVCGAGGGGCIFWLIEPKSKDTIYSLLKNKSGKIIDFKFVEKGLEISEI